MTGDPHSEPLTQELEVRIALAITDLYLSIPAQISDREYRFDRAAGRILRSLVRDVVGPVEYKLQDEQAVSKLRELACIRLEASLAASEVSAEELRREVERLNTVTAWYEEKHRQRRAQVYAAEASAQRLTEALGKIAMLGETPMVGYHNAEAIELARAALDEAQKVKP